MASNIAEIRTKVIGRLKDEGVKITTSQGGDVDGAIAAAVEQYSKDHPRERAKRVQGTGAFKYNVLTGASVLTGFIEGGRISQISYPHLTTDQVPTVLEDTQWMLTRDHDETLVLWFLDVTPSTAEYFCVWYTTPHTVDASTCTVPASDDEALADLGAAEAFERLAARYVPTADRSLDADVTDRRTRVDLYRSLSKDYRERYKAKLGGGDPTRPAQAYADMDVNFSNPAATDRFFHGRARN